MNLCEKNKTINNKIEQNKARYNLDRQKDQFGLYHQEMLVNIRFLTGEDILLEL